MSTIPKPDRSASSPRRSERIKSPKATSPRAKTVAGPHGASKPLASFKYGWRDVPKKLADGRVKIERVPLTLDDVVHPQFGDVHVLSDAHDDDCNYMKDVLKDRYRDDASVVVFSDCGIFWDQPGLRHHSPDLALIFGVQRRKGWKTFHVKTEKVRPALIIEVTSPRTRVNDIETKLREYAWAGVPHYVIADTAEEKNRRLTLLSYRLEGETYREAGLDGEGRAWLDPAGLWLGVTINPETQDDRLALFDPETGEEIGDYTAISRARAQAEARAESEARRAESEARARADAEARANAAEERLRQAEAELRRLRERES
jgi:colicin import membrane protein